MEKILEIKGQNWMEGLSVQTGMSLGGLFQTAKGFDPFERIGFLEPALSPTELTAPATNPVKIVTHWNASSVSYFYGHTNTKLYQYLRNSPYTQTDVTVASGISVSNPVVGGLVWKGRYIYAHATDLRSNTHISGGSTDTQILANSNTYSTLDVRKLVIGADKNLYILDGDSVGKCIINTGTAGNALNAFAIDSDHITRDGLNDGRYLVVLADSNAVVTTARQPGNYSCRAYFWDMSKTTADVIWDFPGESYLIGCGKLGSEILVFGYSGIWVCNSTTEPKMIFSFLGNSSILRRPTSPYQITTGQNSIYWGDGSTNGQQLYAYGSLPGSSKRIFYSPYISHNSTYAHTALSYSAGALVAAVDSPKIYLHNVGSTRGDSSVQTAPIQLPQPATYSHAKVVLRDKLISGQSVGFAAFAADGTVVSDSANQAYSSANPKRSLKFDIKPTSGSTNRINDIYFFINPQAGAIVERVAIYGEFREDANAED